jgi:hypothetical protein
MKQAVTVSVLLLIIILTTNVFAFSSNSHIQQVIHNGLKSAETRINKLMNLYNTETPTSFVNECTLSESTELQFRMSQMHKLLNNNTEWINMVQGGNMGDVLAPLSELVTTMKCRELMEQIVSQTTEQSTPMTVVTDQCLQYDATDPCCNQQLLGYQCCSKRSVTFNVTTRDGTSSIATESCGNVDKLMTYFSNLDTFYTQLSLGGQCSMENIGIRMSKVMGDFSYNFNIAVLLGEECVSDSDCASGKCTSGRCPKLGYDLSAYEQVAALFIKHLKGKGYITAMLNIPATSTLAEIGKKIQESFTAGKCANRKFPGAIDMMTNTEFIDGETESTCETHMVCSDPNLSNSSCSGGSFCGASCFNQCQYVSDSILDKSTCEKAIVCVSGDSVTFTSTVEECYNSGPKNCSVECNNCDKATCESKFKCETIPELDIYSVDGTCVLPMSFKGDSYQCDYETLSGLCYATPDNAISKEDCRARNGTFVESLVGNSCPSYSVCQKPASFGTNLYTLESKDSCEACGGQIVNPVKKVMGTLLPTATAYSGITKYTPRELVSQYQWVKVMDEMEDAAAIMMLGPLIDIVKELTNCMLGAVQRSMYPFICSCAADRDTEASCFGKPYLFEIVKYFPDDSQDIAVYLGQLSLTIPKGAFNNETSINIYTQDPVARNISGQAIYVENANGETVGQIVGSAYSVDKAITNLKICIPLDLTIQQVNTNEYRMYAFATMIGDKYVVSNALVSNANEESPSVICGTISDTAAYYPARVSVPPKPSISIEEDSTEVSSAPRFTRSILVLVIFLVVLF